MNILFFLTPKEDVTYIHDTYTLGRTLERMEEHKYSCIPIINDRGKYVGTLTEGDTTFGKIGVKVWIYKGEILNKKSKGGN